MSRQQIYNTLRSGGLTHEAAIAFIANCESESNCEPGRLEGDFSSFRTVSKTYVARVENGDISRLAFASDQKGFGLCQWTYWNAATKQGRKLDLYDFWKSYGGKLDDPVMQAKFILWELERSYRVLYEYLKISHDLYTCTYRVLYVYENPAIKNMNDRYRYASQFKDELKWEEPKEEPIQSEPEFEPEPTKEIYWPPRMICKGMTGDDVAVLQALLSAHGYEMQGFDGVFDYVTKDQLIKFQQNNVDVYGNKLDADGIAGPKTWGSLLHY